MIGEQVRSSDAFHEKVRAMLDDITDHVPLSKRFANLCRRRKVFITVRDLQKHKNPKIYYGMWLPWERLIVFSNQLRDADIFATWAHELGHVAQTDRELRQQAKIGGVTVDNLRDAIIATRTEKADKIIDDHFINGESDDGNDESELYADRVALRLIRFWIRDYSKEL